MAGSVEFCTVNAPMALQYYGDGRKAEAQESTSLAESGLECLKTLTQIYDEKN